MSSTEFSSSKLGTKEHWDSVYNEELSNFEEIGDEGEIWFGEESIEKMVQWMEDNVLPSQSPSIIEIGSGNGTLLFALHEAGYPAQNITGIDYSSSAIKLAQSIAVIRQVTEIKFTTSDFLIEVPEGGPWDVVLDKGTYDAIALGPKDAIGQSPAAKYPSRASKLMKNGSFFLITSCNFTEEELKTSFITPETGFEYHSHVQQPSFTFGGQTGSVVSTVAFKKCSE